MTTTTTTYLTPPVMFKDELPAPILEMHGKLAIVEVTKEGGLMGYIALPYCRNVMAKAYIKSIADLVKLCSNLGYTLRCFNGQYCQTRFRLVKEIKELTAPVYVFESVATWHELFNIAVAMREESSTRTWAKFKHFIKDMEMGKVDPDYEGLLKIIRVPAGRATRAISMEDTNAELLQ